MKRYAPRKLLVAAVGVATVSYVAACGKERVVNVETKEGGIVEPLSGNLVAPPPREASAPEVVDASAGARDGGRIRLPPTSGNLPAPPSRKNCDPPWYLDADGHRHYKPECLD